MTKQALSIEIQNYNDFTDVKAKPKKFKGASKSKIGKLDGQSYFVKPATTVEFFATRLLNHLNCDFFRNIIFFVKDPQNKSGLKTPGHILTANKVIGSFASLNQDYSIKSSDNAEQMFMYITLIGNYGVNQGMSDDMGYDNFGTIKSKGQTKAFVLDHAMAFHMVHDQYICQEYKTGNFCLYGLSEYPRAVSEDKSFLARIDNKDSTLVKFFLKRCNSYFSKICTEEKMIKAMLNIHLEVQEKEQELVSFFQLPTIKEIVAQDLEYEYPHVYHHSYDELVSFTQKISDIAMLSVVPEYADEI